MVAVGWQLGSFALQVVAISLWQGYGYASGNETAVERGVEVGFKKRKLAEALGSDEEMLKKYGRRMAEVLRNRLAVLKAAANLAAVPTDRPVRRHLLKANRAGQFAVDLVHPRRLVFRPNAPVPRLQDGGIDTERVTAITIIDVVDYH